MFASLDWVNISTTLRLNIGIPQRFLLSSGIDSDGWNTTALGVLWHQITHNSHSTHLLLLYGNVWHLCKISITIPINCYYEISTMTSITCYCEISTMTTITCFYEISITTLITCYCEISWHLSPVTVRYPSWHLSPVTVRYPSWHLSPFSKWEKLNLEDLSANEQGWT